MSLISQVPLGDGVPPNTRNAVSVSFPTWEDNIGYEKGDPRVLNRMKNGYPRFFIARSIQALAAYFERRLALPSESAMLFPSLLAAEQCVVFIRDQVQQQQQQHKQDSSTACYRIPGPGQVRIVQHVVEPSDRKAASQDAMSRVPEAHVTIYCVLFPENLFSLAKQYWQHTGNGISPRLAEYCMRIENANDECEQEAGLHQRSNLGGYRHRVLSGTGASAPEQGESAGSELEVSTYVEERFGRNLDPKYAAEMKLALRRRIAGALTEGEEKHGTQVQRGVAGLSAEDVFLVATGMSAVFYAHQALLSIRRGKSICFGFPYTDTLKILEKFGPGAYFLGHGEGSDYEELERILKRHALTPEDPILAIFTECPSNPLLKTADLPRLRELAIRFKVALIVDETIGNFVNIDALSYADIVVSSLTKVFSGDSNVMGGSIVLNPNSRFYVPVRLAVHATAEDLIWCEDAIFLERNSRDFVRRVNEINCNALAVAELLQASPKVANVWYPKFTTPSNYDKIKRSNDATGYGGLISVTFVSGERGSRAFYDSLLCCKGPSLGTNFTLASPYTLLAHFTELEWAAQYGVDANLVRISVGLEPCEDLLAMFQTSLKAVPDN
ncbi:cystathionine gamma-synthase [Coemansia reversa NRRL 1564]|uniref:Cystathionine gamma-synthase n=1 Tax=Coemansia reversa (strain ATCC 12441 / NRRL 1564) TaxID=763665 RepID=A0A2G5BKE2_COERN|nr:cystathionine gamma-synthase [Coemansia reversa NRRL 1564]|eukprot:PIA19475.1 cystathionine gamma-synthase [Coemansia reversa NRRL 1564]